MSKAAVVIGRNYCVCLGVIRALGLAGYKVSVLRLLHSYDGDKSPEIASKYVEKVAQVSLDDEEAIIPALIESFSDPENKALVFSAGDDLVASLIDKNHERLSKYFLISSVDETPGELLRCMDKGVQKQIARKCGFYAADGVTIEIDNNGCYSIPDTIPFPCYVKPQVSFGSPKSYIKKCETKEELSELLDDISKHGSNTILVEEYLPIEKEYVIPGASCGGKAIIPAFIEKKRIGSGAHKGVTGSGIIIDSADIPELKYKLCRLIEEVNLNGLFDVEVIFSGGKYYFNELNLRYGAAGYAITAAGVNLPAIFADYVLDGVIQESTPICTGVTFVNEKVVFDDCRNGYIPWREYKNDIKSADIRFIYSKDDPKPYKIYRVMVIKARIRRLINKLLKR